MSDAELSELNTVQLFYCIFLEIPNGISGRINMCHKFINIHTFICIKYIFSLIYSCILQIIIVLLSTKVYSVKKSVHYIFLNRGWVISKGGNDFLKSIFHDH